MVSGKKAQIAVLVYVAVAIVAFCLDIPTESVALYPDAPWWHGIVYIFFHANWLHLAVNCWALLCIAFTYSISLPMIVASFIIAACFPTTALLPLYYFPFLPTVGVSGVCYALLGMYSFRVTRKIYYQAWWALFLGIGFIFPSCNAWLHLYCYLSGLLVALVFRRTGR